MSNPDKKVITDCHSAYCECPECNLAPPVNWKTRCEVAEVELKIVRAERNTLWIQLRDSQKELAVIKERMLRVIGR